MWRYFNEVNKASRQMAQDQTDELDNTQAGKREQTTGIYRK